jgi:hypothetical protein
MNGLEKCINLAKIPDFSLLTFKGACQGPPKPYQRTQGPIQTYDLHKQGSSIPAKQNQHAVKCPNCGVQDYMT